MAEEADSAKSPLATFNLQRLTEGGQNRARARWGGWRGQGEIKMKAKSLLATSASLLTFRLTDQTQVRS